MHTLTINAHCRAPRISWSANSLVLNWFQTFLIGIGTCPPTLQENSPWGFHCRVQSARLQNIFPRTLAHLNAFYMSFVFTAGCTCLLACNLISSFCRQSTRWEKSNAAPRELRSALAAREEASSEFASAWKSGLNCVGISARAHVHTKRWAPRRFVALSRCAALCHFSSLMRKYWVIAKHLITKQPFFQENWI